MESHGIAITAHGKCSIGSGSVVNENTMVLQLHHGICFLFHVNYSSYIKFFFYLPPLSLIMKG